MIYYTQLIYIKEGMEDTFHEFEDHVLPYLEKHNGKLDLRLRPSSSDYLVVDGPAPYEIHLVSFASRQDFLNYAKDPARTAHVGLKEASVEKVMLIEGNVI